MKACVMTAVLISSLLISPAPSGAQTHTSGDAMENVGPGSINWTAGTVYATGIGAPPSNASNAAQARAMAARAAQVVAYRNLLEVVKGVRVDSETVVENFMTKSDIIRTRVNGIVRGAQVVKTQYMSDGSVEVTLSMPMKGALLDAVVPDTFGSMAPMPTSSWVPATKYAQPGQSPPQTAQIPPAREKRPEPSAAKPVPPSQPPSVEKKSEPVQPVPSRPASQAQSADQSTVQFKGGKATGIVIDGRGLGLRPALLPKILDMQGQELYVGQVVTRTNAVEQGVAGYAKDVNAAANNFRVTDNPAVMKGIKASGAARTDIVLGSADAQVLRDMSKKGDFLQYCRVIIVY